jgi:predicted Zn-dependent protease
MILCLYHDRSSLADVAGLKGAIEEFYGPYGARVLDGGFLHVPVQGQRLNAARLLRHLSAFYGNESNLSLWVVGAEIFYPGSGPVFGCTAGRSALISKSGLDEDILVKEALHEVGHLLRLDHCQGQCIMNFSDSIEQARQKPLALCQTCTSHLIVRARR